MRLTLVVLLAASVARAGGVSAPDADAAVKNLELGLAERRAGLPEDRLFSADALGGDRKSLDVSVVVAVVQGRLQQLAVRSVADALQAAGGPDGCRNHARDLLDRASKLLLEANASGLKRSDLVDLALSAAHLAVTAGVVQVRYADEARVQRWVEALNAELAAAGRPPMRCDEACAALKARLTEHAWSDLAELFGRTPGTALTCKDDPIVAKVVDANQREWLGIAEVKTGLLAVASMAAKKVVEPGPLLAALKVVPDLSLDQAGLDPAKLTALVAGAEIPAACIAKQLGAIFTAATALKTALERDVDPKAAARALQVLLDEASDEHKAASCHSATFPSTVFAHLDHGGALEALRQWSAALAVGAPASGFSLAELSMLLERGGWQDAGALRDLTAVRELARQLTSALGAAGGFGALPLDQLAAITGMADAIESRLRAAEAAARRVGLITSADAMKVVVSRLRGVQQLLAALATARADSGSTALTLGQLVKEMLALQSGTGVPAILKVLQPVIDQLRAGKKLDEKLALEIVASLDPNLLKNAFSDAQGCFPNSGALAWVFRVVTSMQVALVQGDGKLVLDSDRLVATLAGAGDTFRSTDQWHWFFHLTVGTGALWSYRSAEATGRTAPVIAEQVGFGLGSPSFFGDRVAVKLGLFGSGILYRIVLDNAESQAVMFGGFAAIDLYNLVELFGAPLFLFYPPTATTPSYGSFGFSFGVQVPLGDYLAKVTQKT